MKKWYICDRIIFALCFFGIYVVCYAIVNLVAAGSGNVGAALGAIPLRAYFTGGFVAIIMALTDIGKLLVDWRKWRKLKKKA